MKRPLLVSLIVVALVVAAAVLYFARTRPEEFEPSTPRQGDQPVAKLNSRPTDTASSASDTCVAALQPFVPASEFTARHAMALSVAARRPVKALPVLKEIAAKDPNFPGIHLDVAELELKMGHSLEANEAINAQLRLYGCLSKATDVALQPYCASQFATKPAESCRSEIATTSDRTQRDEAAVRAQLERVPVKSGLPTPVAAPVPLHIPAATGSESPLPTASKALPSPAEQRPAASPEHQPSGAAPATEHVVLKSGEAASHVGQYATVCGAVVSKQYLSEVSGKPTFINLDHAFPEQTFTVVVWGADTPKTGTLPDSGNLCVTGTIITYRGTPEIIVHDAKSWSQSARP